MKTVKLAGLGLFVALVLAASAGAGTAAAASTTLCQAAIYSPYCKTTERYASGTTIAAKSTGNVTITGTAFGASIPIVCSESTLEAKTGAGSGDPLPVDVTKWTLGGCSLSGKGKYNCTMTTEDVGTGGSVLWTEGSRGNASLYGSEHFQKWHEFCETIPLLGTVDCTNTFKPTATFEGGNPAHLLVSKMSPTSQQKGEKGVCTSSTTFEAASYEVTSPKSVYVASGESPGMRLCKANGSPCSDANTYLSGTLIEAKAEKPYITMFNGSIKMTCKEAALSIETKAKSGNPPEGLPIELKTFNLSECIWPFIGICEVTTTFPDQTGSLKWEAANKVGVLSGELHQSWKFVCGTQKNTCSMGAGLTGNHIKNGSPAEINLIGSLVNEGAGAGSTCPTGPVTLSAGFSLTSPNPLYVTYSEGF
jgi:hypothetical protein